MKRLDERWSIPAWMGAVLGVHVGAGTRERLRPPARAAEAALFLGERPRVRCRTRCGVVSAANTGGEW